MLQSLNRVEELLRETMLTTAKGAAFNRLCTYFGYEKPKYISEHYWRKGMLKAVYGARGTPMMALSFLEAIFGEWIDEISTYTGYATARNVMEFDEVSCNLEGRLVRVDGILHRTAYVDPTYSDRLVFVPVNTTMFTGADFTPAQTYELKFLPFDIEEYGCEYRIILDEGVISYPKFYFAETDGQPKGEDELPNGHIMELFSQVTAERFGDQLEGPYPIYLGADEFTSLFFDALDMMLAAGIHERVLLTRWCPDLVSIYGSIYNRKVYGTVNVEIPPLINPTRS